MQSISEAMSEAISMQKQKRFKTMHTIDCIKLHSMYKTNFVCTYKAFEQNEADDEVNSDMLYQAQFLQVFGLTDYNSDAINAGLELIKTKADNVPELRSLIQQHPYNSNGMTDIDMLLPLMFAYPLLDVFHLCLTDAFADKPISTNHRDGVLKAYLTLNN
jgi:hypothetical protein